MLSVLLVWVLGTGAPQVNMAAPGVRDEGAVFSARPVKQADEATRKLQTQFHKEHLIERIQAIAAKREQISFENKDATDFIRERLGQFRNSRLLMYIDPPYYVQGEGLYLNHYTPEDHGHIARLLRSRRHRNWVLSYDNVDPILNLYRGLNTLFFDLQYSLQNVAVAKEVMVFSDSLEVPTAVSNMFLS